MAERVAIVGAGFIGRAWAIAFARAGWEVGLWDAQPQAIEGCLATARELIADLARRALSSERRHKRCAIASMRAANWLARSKAQSGCRRARPSNSK